MRRAAVVAVAVLIALATPAVIAGVTYAAAMSAPSTAISADQAVADARKQLPNDGSGYEVVKTQLEPDSRQFDFSGVDGSRFSESSVEECVIIPPLPLRLGCRPYPVWVVELRSDSCAATIAINGYSGRFGGAGTNGCDIVPEAGSSPWFVATWE